MELLRLYVLSKEISITKNQNPLSIYDFIGHPPINLTQTVSVPPPPPILKKT